MDNQGNKRLKFSPSSFDQIEKETIERLCGTDDRYKVPDCFKGKTPGPWELLHSLYPANSRLQDEAQLFMFQSNYSGCPPFILECNAAAQIAMICNRNLFRMHTQLWMKWS